MKKVKVYAASKMSALSRLKAKLEKDGLDAVVNRAHNCVDVFENGSQVPTAQYYVRQDGTVEQVRCRYQYVGEGNGDYIQKTTKVNGKNFTDEDPYVKNVSGSNLRQFSNAILRACKSNNTYISSMIMGRLNCKTYDEVEEALKYSTRDEILDLYQDIKNEYPVESRKYLSLQASTKITSSTNKFTQEEIDLIEGQCDEAFYNYKDEYSFDEMAEVAWEHIEWLKDELEDVSGNLNPSSVMKYAVEYLSKVYG